MKVVINVCLLLVLLTCPAFAETVSRVAAIVNDEIITTYQLNKTVSAERQKNESEILSDESLKRLQQQILEQMIEEKLASQRIRELGLRVPDEEVESAIEDVQQQNNLTREQLIDALQDQGMDFPTYRENLKNEILRYRLIGREVNSQVEVTNNEIRKYFREHIDEYRVAPTIHLKRISFNIPQDATPEQRAAIDELAEAVRAKLTVEEQPFDVVLASLGNAADGDDMGTLEEDLLQPTFLEAIKDLHTGQVSKPIIATGRLHIFLVAERNPGDSMLFDKVEGEIEAILKQKNTEKRFVEWSQELRDQAHIEILL